MRHQPEQIIHVTLRNGCGQHATMGPYRVAGGNRPRVWARARRQLRRETGDRSWEVIGQFSRQAVRP
jgi:hypothetical protein